MITFAELLLHFGHEVGIVVEGGEQGETDFSGHVQWIVPPSVVGLVCHSDHTVLLRIEAPT